MSVRLMGQVFELSIRPSEKLVLLAMADHARDDGTSCYPSIETLARKTSQSRRGVQKILRRLEWADLIVPTGNILGGRNLATEYWVTLGKGEPGSLFSPAKGRTIEHKRANLSEGRANHGAQRGEPGSPQPSRTAIEPPRNRQSAPAGGLSAAQAAPQPSPFAFSGLHLRVSVKQDHLLGEAFPWVDRQAEYRKADSWLEANPERRPRRTPSFLHNWFSKIPTHMEMKNGGANGNRNQSNRGALRAEPGKYDNVQQFKVTTG